MGKYWHQVITLNGNGEPLFAYHYMRKGAPASKIIIWNTRISRRFCAYYLLDKDLRDIKIFLQETKKLSQGVNLTDPDPNTEDPNKIIIKGLFRSIIITYGKCFSEAKGRKIKIDRSILKKAENLKTHDYLIDIRNQYVAHADESIHENCRQVLPVPGLKNFRNNREIASMLFIEMRQTVIYSTFFEDCFDLVTELQAFVRAKMEDCNLKLDAELQAFSPDKMLKIVKKKSNSRYITYNGES